MTFREGEVPYRETIKAITGDYPQIIEQNLEPIPKLSRTEKNSFVKNLKESLPRNIIWLGKEDNFGIGIEVRLNDTISTYSSLFNSVRRKNFRAVQEISIKKVIEHNINISNTDFVNLQIRDNKYDQDSFKVASGWIWAQDIREGFKIFLPLNSSNEL